MWLIDMDPMLHFRESAEANSRRKRFVCWSFTSKTAAICTGCVNSLYEHQRHSQVGIRRGKGKRLEKSKCFIYTGNSICISSLSSSITLDILTYIQACEVWKECRISINGRAVAQWISTTTLQGVNCRECSIWHELFCAQSQDRDSTLGISGWSGLKPQPIMALRHGMISGRLCRSQGTETAVSQPRH